LKAPFVTFEGIEGSGKTTQVRLLSEYLAEKGIAHLVTREPGGTPLADEIRSLLLSPRREPVFPEAELLLYEAARAQHVRSAILPAMASGKAVLCDRFCDATAAYQGFSRGIDGTRIEWLNAFAAAGLVPDLTFLLDIPPEEGLARVSSRGGGRDRLEEESLRFHRSVRQGYLRLCAQEPERFERIDARLPVDDIARGVRTAVSTRFGW
jgi:dTMP kinase